MMKLITLSFLLLQILEKMQASMTAIEENTATAVSSLATRLDVLEEHGVNEYTMVSNS